MNEVYIKKEDLGEIVEKHFNKDLISIDDLIGLIEELDYHIDRLEEEIEDKEQDIEDNYKPRNSYSLYGVSESDFH
jgi:hypothetical protein